MLGPGRRGPHNRDREAQGRVVGRDDFELNPGLKAWPGAGQNSGERPFQEERQPAGALLLARVCEIIHSGLAAGRQPGHSPSGQPSLSTASGPPAAVSNPSTSSSL